MSRREERIHSVFFFTLQHLYWLLSDADDKSNGSSCYCVTKLKSIMIYKVSLPISLLPVLTATIQSLSSPKLVWMASLVHWCCSCACSLHK